MYDLAIIGGGSAGLTAATEAAAAGLKTIIIERDGRYGGTCRYVGCVPSKTLLHTASILHTMRQRAADVGLPSIDPDYDFAAVMQHLQDVIRAVGGDDGYDVPQEYRDNGGETLTGSAEFVDQHTLRVGDRRIEAHNIIIATGARPNIPEIDGVDDIDYLTWNTLFDLQHLPPRLAIIGGGPLGIELGQAFARLGSTVSVFEAEDAILPQADADAATALRTALEHEGIQFHCGSHITAFRSVDAGIEVVTEQQATTVSHVLLATGLVPNTDKLHLDAANVETDRKGYITVDDHCRTSADTIYACGDVTGGYQFTHTAVYEARVALAAIQGENKRNKQRVVPWAIYTEPALAQAGLTAAEARDDGIEVVTACVPLDDVERAMLESVHTGLFKLVARADTGEVLGATIVAPHADSLIHEAALAIKQRLTVHAIAATIHAYPTYAEGLENAARQLSEQLNDD